MSQARGWSVPIRRTIAGLLGLFHLGLLIATASSFTAEPSLARFYVRAGITASLLLGLACAVLIFATTSLTARTPSWMPGRRKRNRL